MVRTTVDYGIDLGTTNSSIAKLVGTEVEVFENNEGQKYTPSAVWIDKKGRLFVGRSARDRLESDPENAYSEFKLQMGTAHLYQFYKSGRILKPEDLSAEVLKSLRVDAQKRTGEPIEAAVITVPAAFELPQCEATGRAAQLAGLMHSPLLQEPVAAALAYGFQSEIDRSFWMVYDMGGGTFDAALIHIREGVIQVVNHGGDNHLGGKLFDWDIVEQLLVPALLREYPLPEFDRRNPKWRPAFAKLKLHAEEAKVHLSRDTVAVIDIDPLCQDQDGEWIHFEYELRRQDLEQLIEPYVQRSVNICNRVLAEKKLGADSIEKIIMVGGPTYTPLLREILSDRLGIQQEFSIDPLTVVARGAAVFAGTQLVESKVAITQPEKQYEIHLEYKPIDNDPEPLVAGVVQIPRGQALPDATIEFIESKNQWRSGKIRLQENGAFMTSLRAEKGRQNEYLIELRSAEGNLLETLPNRFTYTLGMTISHQPLIHSVGLAFANNEMQIFFKKGVELPSRHREIFRTTVDVKKDQSSTFINVPVLEGENLLRADRNRLIGNLVVRGDSVRRDVPSGSEIEITLVVDESRQIHTMAYIPVLDEEYEEVLELGKPEVNTDQLARDFDQEKRRLERIQSRLKEIDDPTAGEILRRIEQERTIHEIVRSLASAPVDTDAAYKCQSRLLDLKGALDEIEDANEWPNLVAETTRQIEQSRDIVDRFGLEEDRRQLKTLVNTIMQAVNTKNTALLLQKKEELLMIYGRVLVNLPEFWEEYLLYLRERKSLMQNADLADELMESARRALAKKDLQTVESIVSQIIGLLPDSEQQEAKDLQSTIMPLFK